MPNLPSWTKDNLNKFLQYLPPNSWQNGVKSLTQILEWLRKDQPITNNTEINQNYWNQQTINNDYNQNIEYNIKIYNLPQSPETARRPYLKTTDYLNPLGEGGANQTPYNTPKDEPITLLAQTAEQKQTYGRLTYNPQSSQLKQQIRSEPNNQHFDNEIQKFNQQSYEAIIKSKYYRLNNQEQIPENFKKTELQGFLLIPSELKGNGGNGEFLYGISTISALAQKYKANSTIALLPPTNEIPKKKETVNTTDNYKPLKFEDKLQIDVVDNQTLLGFNVFDNFESSIEDKLIELGTSQYENQDNPYGTGNKAPKITSVSEYLTHLVSVLFFRSGFHRLPSILPKVGLDIPENIRKSLKQEGQSLINLGNFSKATPNFLKYYEIIEDNIELQQHSLQSLDTLLGKFPLKIKYQPETGEPTDIVIPNLAEGITELLGMCLNASKDTDTLVGIGIKLLIESSWGKQSLNTIQDFSKAIADYLGFKYEEVEEDITIPINPDGESLSAFLQEKTLKTLTIDNIDKSTVAEQLKFISFVSQITKASQGFNKDIIPGDAISEQKIKDREKFKQEWESFLQEFNKNTATNKYNGVKIKDKSIIN